MAQIIYILMRISAPVNMALASLFDNLKSANN